MSTTMRDILWLRPPSIEDQRNMRLLLASHQAEDLAAKAARARRAAVDDAAAWRFQSRLERHWLHVRNRFKYRRAEVHGGAR